MAAMAFVEFWSLGNECKRSISPIIIRQPISIFKRFLHAYDILQPGQGYF
jgi:hypothetical protein